MRLWTALPLALVAVATLGQTPSLPRIAPNGQLLVDDRPFLVLGGELSNSAAGTAAQADAILPRLAQMHLNTVLVPMAWEQTEPVEGRSDFSVLDVWIDAARQQHLHLALLWFGAWKNGFSNYAPAWVKADPRRFPRALAADGSPTEILSTLSAATLQSDSRAFTALLAHVKQKDETQHTVLLVQVENEVGFLGRGRDRSAQADQLFHAAVPQPLLDSLQAHRATLAPELREHFHPEGKSWAQVFDSAANEAFMAYHYALYINAVAAAGKRAYPLPMYVNCQLPAPRESAGEYPSGGPHPAVLDIYRATAPSLDFFSPDIYWPNFDAWIDRYRLPGNAVFIPETRIDTAPFHAFYAFGEARAFGFSPFNIDGFQPPADSKAPTIAEVYAALESLTAPLLDAQAKASVRGMVLHANSPRPTQTVALGGYLFTAAISRSWPARTLEGDDGAMLVLQTAPDEFLVAGTCLTLSFERDPDTDNRIAGIASIEQIHRVGKDWIVDQRLNGDESNQGRQLMMDPHHVRIYRLRLYAAERQPKL